MKKALVIGGSGFLGSHVADYLQSDGFEVSIFDSIESIWLRDGQKMIVGSVTDMDKLVSAMTADTVVYNFAAIADIDAAKTDPLKTMSVNVIGALTILEAMRRVGAKKFVGASTMYVYGTSGSFYRISKNTFEEIVEEYHQSFGLEYHLLRYGSLYGPRSQHWNSIKRYCDDVTQKGHIRYWGSGEEVREFIHAEDAARLSVEVLEHPEFVNKAVNITGSQSIKINDLFDLVFEIAGKEFSVEFDNCNAISGHYRRSPYQQKTPRPVLRLTSPVSVDLGFGIMQELERSRDEGQ